MVNEFISNLPYEREPQSIYEPIKYVLSLGGKRIRPVLMMKAYEMWREDGRDVLPQAVALETYHNFTLLHDDVMDHADVRRGKPTVHRKWNENTAILSGDNMLLLAVRWMGEKCMSTFIDTAIDINHGQQYDVDFETRNDVTEQEYIEMIRLKTSVLLGCAVRIGAMMAGAPAEDVESLYRFGEAMGLAFQLQDDYLDVYGDPATFGKAIGGDILNAKRTFMLISAYNAANDAQKAELNRLLAIDNPERNAEKIEGVTRLYNELGIPAICRAEIERYSNLAVRSLDKIAFDRDDRKKFIELVNMLIKRDR